jgi:DNA mismatch repair protein MutL
MAKIRILPEQLANQIAAGEVVERPASVVKELLENCLDAGASRIEVEIEGGGTRLIRVIDNGCGMDEDDLLLCLERHGTSKLATAADLAAIGTLGFRGEAIPSIGSVSQLTLTSRTADSPLGTRVVLHYGKLIKCHEIGCGYGTTCEITNLFGNTPARRKFLRTTRTELGHIDEVVKNYSLSSPATTFILRVDGRETLCLDRSQDISERLAAILHHPGSFIPIDGKESTTGREVSGFLLHPEQVTPGPARLRIFVNGRVIRDRMIVHAVTEGMRSFLMKGNNPAGLVHLAIPPGEVDVNVHPAKHEVRFRNAREIHEFLRLAVTRAMQKQQGQLRMHIFTPDRAAESTAIPGHAISFEQQEGFGTSSPVSAPHAANTLPGHKTTPPPQAPYKNLTTRIPPSQPLFATAEPEATPLPGQENDSLPLRAAKGEPRTLRHNLFVIGQYDNLYIFCHNQEGLLVIDQHAAHERLLFEKLRSQYQAKAIVRQTLMFPVTVELSLFQIQLVEKYGEEIDRMGFSLRDFGGNTFIISAIPALAGTTNPGNLFRDVLEQFGSESSSNVKSGYLDTVLATMACKAAVKGGTALSLEEIDTLLNDMAKTDLFSHCPHGRPVVKQFSRDEIKKWFYRG